MSVRRDRAVALDAVVFVIPQLFIAGFLVGVGSPLTAIIGVLALIVGTAFVFIAADDVLVPGFVDMPKAGNETTGNVSS